MHSGFCKKDVKSLGQAASGLTSCFTRALVHCDNKPLQNRSSSLEWSPPPPPPANTNINTRTQNQGLTMFLTEFGHRCKMSESIFPWNAMILPWFPYFGCKFVMRKVVLLLLPNCHNCAYSRRRFVFTIAYLSQLCNLHREWRHCNCWQNWWHQNANRLSFVTVDVSRLRWNNYIAIEHWWRPKRNGAHHF